MLSMIEAIKKIGVVKMDIKNTVKSSIKNLDKYPKWLVSKYKSFVREKAIERVKKELKLRQKDMSDFTDDEMESLLAEEEKKLKRNINSILFMQCLQYWASTFFKCLKRSLSYWLPQACTVGLNQNLKV